MIDIVISYVNNTDPEWIKSLKKYDQDPFDKRYRDYGLLKYLIRGIDKFIPFVNNIFIIVSNKSLIPKYLNNRIKFITHEEFIPKEFLPTFNSCTIECFIPFIKDLGNQFIYLNDDFYVIDYLKEEDFFDNNLPLVRTEKLQLLDNVCKTRIIWLNLVYNSLKIGYGKYEINEVKLCLHTFNPFIKEDCINCFKKNRDIFLNSISQFRESKNLNLFVYLFWSYKNGNGKELYNLGNNYYANIRNIPYIYKCFKEKKYPIICLNDEDNKSLNEDELEKIKFFFEKELKNKSKYEI